MAENRFLDEREAYRILAEGEYGFLSLVTPEGGPYGIPLNYVWLPEERCVFFHCAKSGRKLDYIRARQEVCFTVVGPARVIPERYNTRYESAGPPRSSPTPQKSGRSSTCWHGGFPRATRAG